ncbi:MAG: D-alanyl-D-alanine carboxypeptidase/D-alanyl-D-alanine-endopeptidase [Bacteroidota bacterium]
MLRLSMLPARTLAALVALLLFPGTAPPVAIPVSTILVDAEPPAIAQAPSPPPAAVAPTPMASTPMASTIDAVLDDPELPEAFWGIYVQDLDSGRVVYRRNASLNFIPASNQKLLTTAAALDVLGPDHRFTTTLHFNGDTDGTTLDGDFILTGSGDPTFGSRRVADTVWADPLAAWARSLADAGVTKITGRLVGDGRAFDAGDTYAPGWDLNHLDRQPWAPATSGLSYADNLLRFRVEGTRAGRAARVTAQPESFFRLNNAVSTHRRRRGYSPLRIQRRLGTNTYDASGSVSYRYAGINSIPVEAPVLYTLHHFQQRLEAAGIEVDATLVDAADLTSPPTAAGEPLFVHRSPPVSWLVDEINKRSDNLYAEHLFRALSSRGTLSGGRSAVVGFFDRQGLPTRGLSVRDGSGLSRKDLITPEMLGRLLAVMVGHEHGALYVASMPGGGERATTLSTRLEGVPVAAKTGSLEYVRALSGYATGPDGTRYAFSVMANHYTTRSGRITDAIDQLVAAITSGGLAQG